jgi:predicted house-cleaning noncanonical NTP pyrophosphatase (MazG superfamily)
MAMNKYKQRLSETIGYSDDSRSFEEVYGKDGDSLFEGYEVPDRFKKLFEAEKRKNAILTKRLRENGELMLFDTGKPAKGKADAFRKKAEETMLKSISPEDYKRLLESKRRSRFDRLFEDELQGEDAETTDLINRAIDGVDFEEDALYEQRKKPARHESRRRRRESHPDNAAEGSWIDGGTLDAEIENTLDDVTPNELVIVNENGRIIRPRREQKREQKRGQKRRRTRESEFASITTDDPWNDFAGGDTTASRGDNASWTTFDAEDAPNRELGTSGRANESLRRARARMRRK